jgi:serine/threonine-protein kinase
VDARTYGTYRLIAELGRGGMADVFLAVAEGPTGMGFAKLAVVKRLRPSLAEDEELVGMFLDEGRLCSRLSHPNVVETWDVGQHDGHHYLAMEHLEGQPLHRLFRRVRRGDGSVPREVLFAIVADVLAGLHYAHELRDYDGTPLDVVHRDVTPHNVFVTSHGAVKVMDFGIAKAARRSTETRVAAIKGSVRFMAPEQARRESVDRRSDVFAVGALLFEAATGKGLWADVPEASIEGRLTDGRYSSSPRQIAGDVPEAIDAICVRALAFDRADRYATADEMLLELQRYLAECAPRARHDVASVMQRSFARERESLRKIVEAAVRPPDFSREGLRARQRRGGELVAIAAPTSSSLAPIALEDAPRPRKHRSGKSAKEKKPRPQPAQRVPVESRWWIHAMSLVLLVALSAATALTWNAPAEEGHRRAPRIVASDRTRLATDVRARVAPSLDVDTAGDPQGSDDVR